MALLPSMSASAQTTRIALAFTVVVILTLHMAFSKNPLGSVYFRERAQSALRSPEISGVTAEFFSGQPVRTFRGARLFNTSNLGLERRAPSVDGQRFAKWAVLTTVDSDTVHFLDITQLKGWAVVIVVDRPGKPLNATVAHVVILDATAQEAWAAAFPRLLQLLPRRSFKRKNIGYLYAIAHGAEQIWDSDGSTGLILGSEPRPPTSDVFYVSPTSDCPVLDPYLSIGASAAVAGMGPAAGPRGLPLDLARYNCQNTLQPGNVDKVAVIQSLAQHKPNVDGLYWLARSMSPYFDAHSRQTLVVPKGTLVPYNAQATLVLQPALWSLLLPVTVDESRSDILRGYIAQRLLWDVGLQIAISPPRVTETRNRRNLLADVQADQGFLVMVSELVKYLRQWQGTAPTIAGRFEEIMIQLYERHFFGIEDIHLVQEWLMVLLDIGYTFPMLGPPEPLVPMGYANQGVVNGTTSASRQVSLQSYPDSPFTHGTCCQGATTTSMFPPEQVCRFHRSREGLVYKPEERPSKFGTSCLSYAVDYSAQPPESSILVNVFNAGPKLRLVLTQLIKLTTRPWELVVSFDGCWPGDTSHADAVGVLERMNGWPQCKYTSGQIDVARAWQVKANWTSSQGDIGNECWLQPSSLVGVRFITTNGSGLLETASNNLMMLAARATKYYIVVQDDQLMTTPGWNEKLAYPLEKWPEVFSASARCAHGFPARGVLLGSKCRRTHNLQPQDPAGRCAFYQADSGNRGPLALRANYTQQLGYLDELHHAGHLTSNDDHDLNYRAYHQKGWVSGHIPVDYTEEKRRMAQPNICSPVKALTDQYTAWLRARRRRSVSANNRWTGASGTHNHKRIINDSSWHPLCTTQVLTT